MLFILVSYIQLSTSKILFASSIETLHMRVFYSTYSTISILHMSYILSDRTFDVKAFRATCLFGKTEKCRIDRNDESKRTEVTF